MMVLPSFATALAIFCSGASRGARQTANAPPPVLFEAPGAPFVFSPPNKEGGGAPNGAPNSRAPLRETRRVLGRRGRNAFRRSTRGVFPKLPGTALPDPDRWIV